MPSNQLLDRAPEDAEGFASLTELALDMRSSWNHLTDELWIQLDRRMWELTQNPWVVLQTASHETLHRKLADPKFKKLLDGLVQTRRESSKADAWFHINYSRSPFRTVAYFSMEFMLSEALPIYSGGLGNVAGDQLKAASDLGVPVIAIGLLYARGYFRQQIEESGAQQALYPYNDPAQLPVTPVRDGNGDLLRLEITLPGYSIWLRAWQVQVGRVMLYLLDSNDAANYPVHRGLTGELYGGTPDIRIRQELVLGVGGWRLLRALGMQPEVCHLNEGHAAFVVLERASDLMKSADLPFETAFEISRAGNIFTTHTAVAAGFDRYPPELIRRFLMHLAEDRLHISIETLLGLGRANPSDDSEPFNMAYLAVRGSGAVNGVSRLHAEVSRQLFAPLFPRWPIDEIPIGAVTNGIHTPTWDSAAADALWTEACGQERWIGRPRKNQHGLRAVSDERMWAFRNQARSELVTFVRARARSQLAIAGASTETMDATDRLFDGAWLTLGFARRFATYKRPNLLLHDPARLARLLTDAAKPVQLVIAGKAHPADQGGQAMIQEWTRFAQRDDVRSHVVFLSDYDMRLTQELVRGVDVWINTPRRPWEACGTSGMKVLVNGGVNLSELDGWWAEAYTPDVGWALGDGETHGDDPERDAGEAVALYEMLERSVVPEFYDRADGELPRSWIARVRRSMEELTARFSAERAVREYTENYYIPGAKALSRQVANSCEVGRQLVAWRESMTAGWQALRFVAVRFERAGDRYRVQVDIETPSIECAYLQVELYAAAHGQQAVERVTMIAAAAGETLGHVTFHAEAPAKRAETDYTPRILPKHPDLHTPLHLPLICWQH